MPHDLNGAANEGPSCMDVTLVAGRRFIVRIPHLLDISILIRGFKVYACGNAVNVLSGELVLYQSIHIGALVKGVRCGKDGSVCLRMSFSLR
jgi:hypothetical protein